MNFFKKTAFKVLGYISLIFVCVLFVLDLTHSTWFNITLPNLNDINTSLFNIKFLKNNYFTIGDSKQVPHIYSEIKGYGIIFSSIIKSNQPFTRLKFIIDEKNVTIDNSIIIEVQVSNDSINWTAWYEVIQKNNNIVDFSKLNRKYRYLKYRVTLISKKRIFLPIIRVKNIKGS